ncbi:hypothetical protein [Terriglobus aquaticus]|uniref:Uncharacterized protein n=1 Tax=Terriglobus aquaticus TaxID=940139 RepID=A0ABW9KHW1_9BACT|nr:hypothetical protein [Terriglobus aquaticus]
MTRTAACFLIAASCVFVSAASGQRVAGIDSDGDGLSDALEARLIEQFRPVWMVSENDCSKVPARFVPDASVPRVGADDGTIYAQASPGGRAGEVEIHYYHLWRRDCGEMGHALDTEHVAVLLRSDGESWKASAWYAAAHEDTVCDAGQVTRASTIDAVDHGARVWVSAGKHASYFAERLCNYGCGGDRCVHMHELPAGDLINLGEANVPSVAWTHAPQWPLLEKMTRSDFTVARMSRLERLPETDIAWATPEKRPAQAAILGVNAGLGGAGLGASTGARGTNTAMVVTTDKTGHALGSAARHTGGALKKSYRGVRRALGGRSAND